LLEVLDPSDDQAAYITVEGCQCSPTFLKVVKAMNAGAADGKLQSKVSKEGKAAAVGVGVGSGAGQPLKPKSATKFKVTSGAGKIKVLYRGT
jgi:hypothetical protein